MTLNFRQLATLSNYALLTDEANTVVSVYHGQPDSSLHTSSVPHGFVIVDEATFHAHLIDDTITVPAAFTEGVGDLQWKIHVPAKYIIGYNVHKTPPPSQCGITIKDGKWYPDWPSDLHGLLFSSK